MDEIIGTTILGYRVERVLGSGGMAVVYECRHEVLDLRLALKVVLPEWAHHPVVIARFEQEGMLAAKVRQPPLRDRPHRHVVGVISAGRLDNGRPFVLMDYLTGKDLAEFVSDPHRGPIDVETASSMFIQLCSVLSEAHGAGLVHRDLKPSNVFITSSPELEQHVKLLDFGLASVKESVRVAAASTKVVTVPGTIMGTLTYMAPEQMEGSADIDHRADIFALGCVMYRVLTGRDAYLGSSFLELARQKENLPPPMTSLRDDLDPRWDTIIARCLNHGRAFRYDNVRMIAVDIAAACPDGARVFAAAWPRFAAEADDFTVRNDGTIAPPPSTAPSALMRAAHRPQSSLEAAAGAVTRPAAAVGKGARLILLGSSAALVAALAVVGVTRSLGAAREDDSTPAEPAQVDQSVGAAGPARVVDAREQVTVTQESRDAGGAPVAAAGVDAAVAVPRAPEPLTGGTTAAAVGEGRPARPTKRMRPRRERSSDRAAESDLERELDPNGVLGL
jgi:hypothetical protein